MKSVEFRRGESWQEWERVFLRQNFVGMSVVEMGEVLGRPEQSVRMQCRLMGLDRQRGVCVSMVDKVRDGEYMRRHWEGLEREKYISK